MAESEEELKSFLIKVKEESGKSWLKAQHSKNKDHGIWSHHFMGNRWGNSGNGRSSMPEARSIRARRPKPAWISARAPSSVSPPIPLSPYDKWKRRMGVCS